MKGELNFSQQEKVPAADQCHYGLTSTTHEEGGTLKSTMIPIKDVKIDGHFECGHATIDV